MDKRNSMQSRWWLVTLLVLLACAGQEGLNTCELIVCDSPYIRHAFGCCLDVNGNAICDGDDNKAVPPAPVVDETPTPSAPVEQYAPPTPIVEEIEDAVVALSWKAATNGRSTGFFVGDDLLLTSWSAVEAYFDSPCDDENSVMRCKPQLTATLPDASRHYDFRVIARNTGSDLALIELIDLEHPNAVLSLGETTLQTGEVVTAVASTHRTPSRKSVSVGREGYSGMYLSEDLTSGDLGSPLVQQGQVAGVVSLYDGNYFTQHLHVLNNFVDSSLNIRCHPTCGVRYERYDNDVLIYKPKLVEVGRNYGDEAADLNDEVGLRSFTMEIRNTKQTNLNVCFDLQVVRDGFTIHQQRLEHAEFVRPDMRETAIVPVHWKDISSPSAKADYQFLVASSDCDDGRLLSEWYVRDLF